MVEHMNKQRLSKLLAAAGVASRRQADEIIAAGRVKVNGEVILTPYTPASFEDDVIEVDDKKLTGPETKVTYALNKPAGYLCSSKRRSRRDKLAIDLVPEGARLFTVGRLDKETKGLILVTNDGDFAQKVIHPSSDIEREYLVKVGQEVMPKHLEALSKGCVVEEKWVTPVSVTKVRRGTLKIVVKEGRKREVRHLVDAAGLTLRELTRIRIGSFVLGGLQEGTYRTLSDRERSLVFE